MCQVKNKESGFSLIELIIAIVVLTIVTASIFSLLNQSLRVNGASSQVTEAQQGLRISQEYIDRDLYNAADSLIGFRPIIKSTFASTYLSQNAVVETHPISGAILTRPGFVETGMIWSNNESAAVAIPHPPASEPNLKVKAGTDRLTMMTMPDPDNAINDVETVVYNGARHTANSIYVTTASTTDLSAGQIYLLYNAEKPSIRNASALVCISSISAIGTTGTSEVFFLDTPATYTLNQNGLVDSLADNEPDTKLMLRKVWLINYFIDEKNRLKRRVFGQPDTAAGLPFTETLIAENAIELEFEYILRLLDTTTGNPLPPSKVFELTTFPQLTAVRQVRVDIKTQTTKPVINNQVQPVTAFTIISPRNMQFRGALEPD